MDVVSYNRDQWNKQVAQGNPWTIPVTPEQIAAARRGEWAILLTNQIFVPRTWFPHDLTGVDILCLASGGGQQGPILAAAGANVTVFDNSPKQLEQDQLVAEREGLTIRTVQGDMRDLSAFADGSFDLIFHPVSNVFVHEIRPVWRECARVLRRGGVLMAGFMNPFVYLFDMLKLDRGEFEVRHRLPYSDLTSISERERLEAFGPDHALEFGHTLTDQIGGQLEAGFVLTAMYEDYNNGPESEYMPSFMATRAVKWSMEHGA